MYPKIDPREVLIYLNELGYTNITAEQLKEFIIDLKKLLKYDSRFGGFSEGANKEQPSEQPYPEESQYCECDNSENKNDSTANGFNNKNQINGGKEVHKEAEVLKEKQKDQHIAVHIYDTKSQKKLLHDHCVHINKLKTIDIDTNSEANKLKFTYNTIVSGSPKGETETESTVKSIQPSSTRECQSRASNKERKSKVTFIRPATSRPSFTKSDPVALYHYYQSEWKRTKIPGQDKRDDLRWAVRARMLSGPRVEVKSRCFAQRCGWR